MLGGGTAGRLVALAAQTLGYRVDGFEPRAEELAAGVAEGAASATYGDHAALKDFARRVDVILCTREDLPVPALEAIAPLVPLHPRADVLYLCQNRLRTKQWLRAQRLPHGRFAEALDGDVAAAVAQVGRPAVVKTADFSREGQGQMRVTNDAELAKAAEIFRGRRCVVERWMDLRSELVLIVARASTGELRALPAAECIQARHGLDLAIMPARLSAPVVREAELLARTIAERLGVIGLLAVELLVTDRGEVLVNEFSPRPHAAGNGAGECAATSQWEQQVRAACGLPLGSTEVREATVTVSLRGEAWGWREGKPVGEPHWEVLLAEPRVRLQLYGKAEPRRGRMMGHFTVRGAEVEALLVKARELKERLQG